MSAKFIPPLFLSGISQGHKTMEPICCCTVCSHPLAWPKESRSVIPCHMTLGMVLQCVAIQSVTLVSLCVHSVHGFACLCPPLPLVRVVDVFSSKPSDDPTLFTVVLKQTELMGLMQLLYAILLSDGPPRHSHSPPPLSQHTQAVAMAAIKAVNNSAILDLKMVQVCTIQK